jgi:chromate transporter
MGAVMAVLGITLPTFVLVFLLSLFYSKFENHPKIEAALKGVHGAIIALIMIAAYKMAKISLFDKATAAIAVITLGLLLFTPIHPLALIVGGIASGIVLIKSKRRMGMEARTEKDTSPAPRQELQFPEYYI